MEQCLWTDVIEEPKKSGGSRRLGCFRVSDKELPSEVSSNFRKFLLSLFFPFDALEIEWFAFQQLNRFSAFWKFSQQISCLFVPVQECVEYLVEWNSPPNDNRHLSPVFARLFFFKKMGITRV